MVTCILGTHDRRKHRADSLATRLEPTVTGWFAHERQFGFDPRSLEWHAGAKRFEQGTPALAAVYSDAGIVADARPGHVRLSPYFYNTFEDNAAAIETLTS